MLIFALFYRSVCAQSYGSASMVELVAAVGTVVYQTHQKEPVVPDFVEEQARWLGQEPIVIEEINDEIEKPYDDEDGLEDQLPTFYGYTDGLNVRVQGKKASFLLSRHVNKLSSRLSRFMHEQNISQIDIHSGQLDIFPEDQSKSPVSVILPVESEPLMPVTGYDWLDESEGLAFVQLQCMEAIAATADAVMSGQPTGWHVGLEESDAELIQESEQVWFDLEELGGMLYSTEPVPEKPSEYDRIEVLHETHGIVIELDFGIETIRLYVTKNNERHVLGAFEHLVKKTGDGSKGEDDDSSSESENVEASPAAASSEASEKPAQDTESADHSPESHDRNPYWIDGPSSPFAPDYQTFYDYYHAGPISPSYSPYEPTEAGSPKPEAETEAKPEPEKALKRQHPEPERPEPYEPENKRQKSDSAFPESTPGHP